MALDRITVDKFIGLKNRLKAELGRRKYNYAVSNINVNYTNEPDEGDPIEIEHYQKIVGPMAMVDNECTQYRKQSGGVVEELDVLDAKLSILETTSKTHSTGNCSGNCTGLCSGTCSDTCSGSCGNTCSSSCGAECSGTCGGGCSGSCSSCTGCTSCSGCSGSPADRDRPRPSW
mgnify:CR=1 FL=1